MVLTHPSFLMSYSIEHLKFLKSDLENAESGTSGVTSRKGKKGNLSCFIFLSIVRKES
jgi:hypothetical protein